MNNLPNFFIDFEKTSTETHEKILAALQAELDEAKAEKRIPIWDQGLARLSGASSLSLTQ